LGPAGSQLWDDITANYDLRPDESALLAKACLTADELDVLQAAWDANETLLVKGSHGGTVVTPVLRELRAHRLLLKSLLDSLKLSTVQSAENEDASWNARRLARARWG
jgi:hypothetical protein